MGSLLSIDATIARPRPPCKLGSRMSLSSEEVERYARQIVLRGLGGPGQNKLKARARLVVGAGGLGSPALQYLAGAGVGTLGIVDDDVVSLSNLHRQVLHDTGDVGAAEDRQRRGGDRAPQSACRCRADASAADGRERPRPGGAAATSCSTAPTISPPAMRSPTPACMRGAPWFSAAIGEFDGTLTTLKPYENGRRRRTEPDLPLPISRAAARRDGADLRRSRRAWARSPACSAR